MSSLEDEIIEEAALIWLHERDGVPCSIRRARLRAMCRDLAREKPFMLTEQLVRDSYTPHWPMPDRKCLAAHDDTFEP